MCNMSFCKGLVAGLAVGLAVGMAAAPKKPCKNRAFARFLRCVGGAVDGIGGMFG